MRTLVPKSLWSCPSQPIGGSTRAGHRAMLGLALEERVKHLDKAVHQAHDWLCSNPLPWDPIPWAHPSDPLNPFSVSHGAFSTSVHMPPRTRSYTSTPHLSPNTPQKNRPSRRQPKHNQLLAARQKTPNARPAAHPHHAPPPLGHSPPSSALTPTATTKKPSLTTNPSNRNRLGALKARQDRSPPPTPRSKARYRQTRLPLPSRPTATRCPGPSAPAPPHSNASRDIRNFFRPSSDLLSPPLDPFSPLPLPEPPPSPKAKSAFI